MTKAKTELQDTLINLMGKLHTFFEESIQAGIAPEGLVQLLTEEYGPHYQDLKRKHATPVEYPRRITIEGKIAAMRKDNPAFKLGLNTSFYSPYKGLTNTVRVHHDFLLYPLGEFKQVMIEEDGTFFVPVDEGQLHVTPDTTMVVLAKISATNPTIGRRYDNTPPVQQETTPNQTDDNPHIDPKRGAKGVDQDGDTGTSS